MGEMAIQILIQERAKAMLGEIVTAAIIPFTLILVGLSLGFLIIKVQGSAE
jgi:hypothetical protein